MRKLLIFFSIASIILIQHTGPAEAAYDKDAPLYIKDVRICRDKPRGIGRFNALATDVIQEDQDEIYLYVEVDNCKPTRDKNTYLTSFAVDVDIYYEDGICVYSGEEAAAFDYHSPRADSEGYLWVKVNTAMLKEGEYKIEMTVRDQSTGKEGFTLARFKKER